MSGYHAGDVWTIGKSQSAGIVLLEGGDHSVSAVFARHVTQVAHVVRILIYVILANVTQIPWAIVSSARNKCVSSVSAWMVCVVLAHLDSAVLDGMRRSQSRSENQPKMPTSKISEGTPRLTWGATKPKR